MRNLACALLVSLFGAGAVGLAQDVVTDTKTKTQITVQEGKDITVTGCVARSGDGNFSLTHAAGKAGALGSYMLVARGDEREELGKHVGHRVEVKGKAADQGDGRMTIKTESETRRQGDTRKRESTTKVEGDLEGLPFLGVKSVRMLASICP